MVGTLDVGGSLSFYSNVRFRILLLSYCSVSLNTTLCVHFCVDGKSFKTRDDFSSVDDYARYVKENIKVGVMVKCCEAYEEVRHGDIGRVMKVSLIIRIVCLCMHACTSLWSKFKKSFIACD